MATELRSFRFDRVCGFRVWGLEFRVRAFGFKFWGLESGIGGGASILLLDTSSYYLQGP